MNTENKLIGTGLLTAISASLCCITPVLALIAGTSGVASTFSWIEPYRPYLIVVTVLVLGFAWYQKLKHKTIGATKDMDCACETDDPTNGKAAKPKFLQSKSFLAIVTVFAIVMLAFPYFSGIFYPNSEKQTVILDKSHIKSTEFKINGMTCASCEEHVNHEINKLNGIVHSKTSFQNGSAIVEFDRTKTNETDIEKAINSTGYSVTDKKVKQWKSN